MKTIVVESWDRWGGLAHPNKEGAAENVRYEADALIRDWRCGRCGKMLVQYAPGQHDVDEWHVACGTCGEHSVFVYANDLMYRDVKIMQVEMEADADDPAHDALSELLHSLKEAI